MMWDPFEIGIEDKGDYVNRQVETWAKDYTRQHELEGIEVDPDEFKHRSIEVKHDAEDSYDRWRVW